MDKAKNVSAVLLVVSGIIMCFCGFFAEPIGEIDETVLAYLGECLIWAGSMFGMTEYVRHQINKVKFKDYDKLNSDKEAQQA